MTIHQRLNVGRYRLRIEDYAMLGDTGVFGDAATELIAGDILVMSPEWIPHMRVKDELAYRLRRSLENRESDLFVGTGGSVELSDHDVPRPDIIVARKSDGKRGVPLEAIALLVEVSSTTLPYDLNAKQKLYAAFGIPEYWVVDVSGQVIHQMWTPKDGSYTARHAVKFGTTIVAAAIHDLAVETTAL